MSHNESVGVIWWQLESNGVMMSQVESGGTNWSKKTC